MIEGDTDTEEVGTTADNELNGETALRDTLVVDGVEGT